MHGNDGAKDELKKKQTKLDRMYGVSHKQFLDFFTWYVHVFVHNVPLIVIYHDYSRKEDCMIIDVSCEFVVAVYKIYICACLRLSQ